MNFNPIGIFILKKIVIRHIWIKFKGFLMGIELVQKTEVQLLDLAFEGI
jgi:hypothetical protein